MQITYGGAESPAHWIRNDAIPGDGLKLSYDRDGQDGQNDLNARRREFSVQAAGYIRYNCRDRAMNMEPQLEWKQKEPWIRALSVQDGKLE